MENRAYSQGAEITGEGVSFRTWADKKKDLSVAILAEDGSVLREIPLVEESDGYYTVLDQSSGAGTLYKYRIGGNLFPDLASRFQPHGVHGPSQVVDARPFAWTDSAWTPPKLQELVIYELHVGTFTSAGKFISIIERFEHLKRLGINAIELMPVADFAGDRNWGYDGVSIYAPSRVYGSPDELRTLVNAAHQAGLAILLDVVYNHLGPDGNYMSMYSDQYFNTAHHTPWGAAFNLDGAEALPVRNFFSENPIYWIKEFHVDGFRLDATHAILDESPKHLIQEMAEGVQALGSLIICEDPRNDRKLVLARQKGGYGCDAVWADDFHHVVRVQLTKEDEGYMGYFKGTMKELRKTLRTGWLFTGAKQKDGIRRGTKATGIEPEHFVHCISNHDQVGNRAFGDRLNMIVSPASYRAASALLLTAPYTPMLFMGQEWAASTPFLYFTDHHDELGRGVTEGRRKEFAEFSDFRDPEKRDRIPDPQALKTFTDSKLNWSETEQLSHRQILALYTDFLRFHQRELRDRRRRRWRVAQVSETAIALRYRRGKTGDILVLVQLLANDSRIGLESTLLQPTAGRTWRRGLSSNEQTYGGDRPGYFDTEKNQFVLAEPELIVFAEQ
jgi:malto-oligosyltrehalose trehalohydrolase